MSAGDSLSETTSAKRAPITLAKIKPNDVVKSLGDGLRDMLAAPGKSLFFGLAYAAFGWLILFLMIGMNWGAYAYPLATGFALVAPMAAAGLYGISEQIERGEAVTWQHVASCLYGRRGESLRIMAVVTTFAYIIWIDIAAAIYIAFWGMTSLHFQQLLQAVFTTPYGFAFLILGNLIGAALALVVFSIMAISLPLLFDRNTDFVTAMITSVQAVIKNPIAMLFWCLIIAFLLVVSFATAFTALIFIFPLLGHATWHLYRRLVPKVAAG